MVAILDNQISPKIKIQKFWQNETFDNISEILISEWKIIHLLSINILEVTGVNFILSQYFSGK